MLKDASTDTEFDGFQFELYQAGDFKSEASVKEGVTFYLYRVAINGARRSLPPTTAPDGRRYRAALPVDLYYLLTPWAKSAAKQHRLLGWAMRQLQDLPIIPASLLNHYVPEADTFRQQESIELVCESPNVQDIQNILSPLELNQPLFVVYIARSVLLESELLLGEGEPVQARVFDYGKGPEG